MQNTLAVFGLAALTALALESNTNTAPLQEARITGEGWRELSLADFVNVNGTEDTWKEGED